jgi:peptidoglycan hydrolase-like protein with peptidoglycan-binding domain
VRTLLNRLKTAYAAYAGQIVVDGDFGPMTRGAVMEFQKRSNLEVDGVVGAQTAAALRI